MKKEILEWIKTIVLSLIIAMVITTFIKPTIVRQYSMRNTLEENDFLIINRLLYRRAVPKRGDIIVFQSGLEAAGGREKLLIKRVIAIPGDEIFIRDGKVMINGEYLKEDYLADPYTEGNVDLIVPEGKLFVMGDNRKNSLDSRDPAVGLIDRKDIMGEAFIRLYPFDRIGLLH